jgi:hypothetical protein
VELQEIDVFIDPDGQVRLEVRGVKGPACLELTRELEAALGGRVAERMMTAEATESASETAAERAWATQS